MLLLELCELCLLCGDLFGEHALQGGEGTLAAGQVAEGTLYLLFVSKDMGDKVCRYVEWTGVMSRFRAELCTA